jgi:hypothetical protein
MRMLMSGWNLKWCKRKLMFARHSMLVRILTISSMCADASALILPHECPPSSSFSAGSFGDAGRSWEMGWE